MPHQQHQQKLPRHQIGGRQDRREEQIHVATPTSSTNSIGHVRSLSPLPQASGNLPLMIQKNTGVGQDVYSSTNPQNQSQHHLRYQQQQQLKSNGSLKSCRGGAVLSGNSSRSSSAVQKEAVALARILSAPGSFKGKVVDSDTSPMGLLNVLMDEEGGSVTSIHSCPRTVLSRDRTAGAATSSAFEKSYGNNNNTINNNNRSVAPVASNSTNNKSFTATPAEASLQTSNKRHARGGTKRNGEMANDFATGNERMNGANSNVPKVPEGLPAGGAKHSTKIRLSLKMVLLAQSLLIIGAFIAMVTVSNAIASQMAETLVRRGIEADLTNAAIEVNGPISSVSKALNEYRKRYFAYTNVNNGTPPCSLTSGNFNPSALFYADAIHMIEADKLIQSVNFVRQELSIFDYTTGRPLLDQCSASTTGLFRRFRGVGRRTRRTPVLADFSDLDHLIPHDDNVTSRSSAQLEAALTALKQQWIPLTVLTFDKTRYMLVLVASNPIWYNVTNALAGTQESLGYFEVNETHLTTEYLVANPHVSIKATSALSITVLMSEIPAIMRSVTPATGGAHTSLYDLARGTLLSTSVLPDDAQLEYTTGALYAAGGTPVEALNEAFATAKPHSLRAGEVRIVFGRERVVSSYLYSAEELGIRFAVVQSTPRDYYFGPMKTLRLVMIVVGVCSALAVVAACVFVGATIVVSGQAIIANMALAARLKNDRTVPVRSFLSEIQQLADGFDAMNGKLLEARAYLPQHMLMTSSDESSGSEEEEGTAGEENEASSALHAGGVRSRAQSSTAGGDSTTRSGSRHQQHRHHHQQVRDAAVDRGVGGPSGAAGADGLALKRVTVLAVNGRGFHGAVNVSAPSSVAGPSCAVAELVASAAHSHKGVIDSFHGDHFIVSFNAARSNAEGPAKAARCALDIAAEGGHIKALGGGGLVFAMGISTGRACVGNVGTSTLKRLSIIGPVYSKAIALERLCKRFNRAPPLSSSSPPSSSGGACSGVQCLMDGLMATEVQHSHVLQVVGALCGSPFVASGPFACGFSSSRDPYVRSSSSTSVPVVELVHALRKASSSSGREDEWLYELGSGASSRVAEVNGLVAAYLAEAHQQGVREWRERLTECQGQNGADEQRARVVKEVDPNSVLPFLPPPSLALVEPVSSGFAPLVALRTGLEEIAREHFVEAAKSLLQCGEEETWGERDEEAWLASDVLGYAMVLAGGAVGGGWEMSDLEAEHCGVWARLLEEASLLLPAGLPRGFYRC